MLSVGVTARDFTALNQLSTTSKRLGETTNKLATGLRINSGRDDPAGLIAAENLRGDLVELGARQRTIGYERSQIAVEQSGRQLATSVLQDLRGLAIQASGDTVSDDQLAAIQSEIDSSLDGLDHIANVTGVSFGVGLEELRSGGSASIDGGDTAAALEAIDQELETLALATAEAGAYEKYTLDVEQRLAEDQQVVTAQALSEIADTEFGQEASNLTREQILFQASLQTVGVLNQVRGEGLITLLDALA